VSASQTACVCFFFFNEEKKGLTNSTKGCLRNFQKNSKAQFSFVLQWVTLIGPSQKIMQLLTVFYQGGTTVVLFQEISYMRILPHSPYCLSTTFVITIIFMSNI
jgi:hypothetical protein